ncbi:MAG TPA: TlpA disulfide reductase family protein [Paludibacteraceae bacterium]|nr:TlpA disulfide reductase family protein [Paludibacteraceae bacterium]HRS67747.1 TlpA disulfide reductase family protein [Paludibacteraceae bacterium]
MKKIHVFCFMMMSCALTAVAQEDGSKGYIVSVGDMAPDFTVQLDDGTSVQLSSLRGKVVMLQFTASWCGVCRKEMPFIERDIWQKHKFNPNFVLIGIDREEPLEKIISFKESVGVTYPIGLDLEADIFTLFAQRNAGITRNVLIDESGKIVLLTRLFYQDQFDYMCALIDTMLKN